MVTGFVRNTLRANRCDIIMGYAQGDELVQNTNAYYRSTYVLVYPKGSGLDGVETIEDPQARRQEDRRCRRTPPTANMAAVKLMRTAKIYPLMVDTRLTPSMAEVMIKDMLEGEIDAAIVWGPMAGYYAAERSTYVAYAIVPRKPTSAITIAASSVARTPLDPASTTITPTTSTPNRSIATIRSGNVGPFTRRMKATSSATPSVTSVMCEITSSMVHRSPSIRITTSLGVQSHP